MIEIEAVYESGVFRPVEPIALPERTRVTVAVPDPPGVTRPGVRDVLARRYDSGTPDGAVRHDDHQP